MHTTLLEASHILHRTARTTLDLTIVPLTALGGSVPNGCASMDDPDELLMLYDGPTSVLEGRDVESVAKYMRSPQCKQVFVIVRTSDYHYNLSRC